MNSTALVERVPHILLHKDVINQDIFLGDEFGYERYDNTQIQIVLYYIISILIGN